MDIANIIIAAVVAIWGIAQVRITSKLQSDINRLNAQLNQSLNLLHRARDAAIEYHKMNVFLMEYLRYTKEKDGEIDWTIYATKQADLSASKAELRGLAFAIKDDILLKLVNQSIPHIEEFRLQDSTGRVITQFEAFEMELRGKSQKIHTRIAELIEQETSNST